MAPRLRGVLVGLALLGLARVAGAAPRPAGNELTQMTALVRFLGDRIRAEDPTLAGDLHDAALLDALEMMGIEVPRELRRHPPRDPEKLAMAILTAPPPAPRAAAPGEELTRDPFAEAEAGAEAESSAGVGVAPGPAAPPAPPAAFRPDPDRVLTIRKILDAFPIPAEYRREPSTTMPPIALMARTLLTDPDGRNPWEPQSMPTGAALAEGSAEAGGTGAEPEGGGPRVVVPEGGRVEVTGAGGDRTLGPGRHELGWGAGVRVLAGERVLLVYPRMSAVFRLGAGSRARVESQGVRRLEGSVERFLSRPGVSVAVLPG